MDKEEFVKKMTNICLIAMTIGFVCGWLVGKLL